MEVSDALRQVLDDMGGTAGTRLGVRVHSLLSPSERSVEDTAEDASGADSQPPRGSSRGTTAEPEAPTLHVSLSHPLPLRRPLARTFPADVARALRGVPAFRAGLAWPPKVYRNAPRRGPRRAFLALRTAAGARELRALLARVDALLRTEHLPTYHAEPEFHTSFAWWLDADGAEELDTCALEAHRGAALDALRLGWNVGHVCVKVAKTVTRIPLRP